MNPTMAQYQNNFQNNLQNNFQSNFQNNAPMAPTVIVYGNVTIHNQVKVPKRAKNRQRARQNRQDRQRRQRAEHQRLRRQFRNLDRLIRGLKERANKIYKFEQSYEQRTADGASYKYEIKSESSTR